MTVRWFKVNWSSFAKTGHWLQGAALFGYLLREHYVPAISDLLNSPSPLFRHLEGSE